MGRIIKDHNYEEAYGLLQEALESALQVYPNNHRIVLTMKNNLLPVYCYYGELQLAHDLAKEVYEGFKSIFDINHPQVMECLEIIREIEKNMEKTIDA